MFQRDQSLAEGLHQQRIGYTLVVRAPGAHRITVPARHHFLDIYLGKSPAAYGVRSEEVAGDISPPATFVFLPAGKEREITATRSGRSVQLAFEPHLLETTTVESSRNDPTDKLCPNLRSICHAEDDSMIGIANQLSGLWRSDFPEPSPEQLDAIATLLIMQITRHISHSEQKVPHSSCVSKRVQQVLDYIESDLSSSHTLNQLADIAALSTYHFARMFRQATGRSPHQYVVERRIAHAKRRLSHSDDPIVEIALDCGFGSQSHMTDVFSKVLGKTPGAVRKAAA